MRIVQILLSLTTLAALTALAAGFVACGSDPVGNTDFDAGTPGDTGTMTKDSGSTDSGSATTFAVGGTVTGIAGSGLILDNGEQSDWILQVD